ncbi:MAG: hypothetical protein ABI664_08745 [bacterium]
MRKALAGLLITIVLLASAPASLLAHGRLKSSSPAAGTHLAQVPKQLCLESRRALITSVSDAMDAGTYVVI